jgi:glycosyltransferase involved in cell wall biosynthesis
MEGTGIAGGALPLADNLRSGRRYVVSSGDAVGPYLGSLKGWLAPVGTLYEWLLCRRAAGFIGWSPYLVGRALTFGTPRGMTAAHWADFDDADRSEQRRAIRDRLGIPQDAVVYGIVGSLNWRPRRGYCYGYELVRAVERVAREDVVALVVGDGDGRERLAEFAGERLGRRVFLPGRIAPEEVPGYLAAMDVASLPQSVDGVGSFRYTTKISEYLKVRMPIVTGQTPLAYDLDEGGIWRLGGEAPWDDRYIAELAALMTAVTAADVAARRPRTDGGEVFSLEAQRRRVADFIRDVARADGG